MRKSEGFTLIELLIVVIFGGIVLAIAFGAMNGKSLVPTRESCTSQGGKWSEGIQYGHMTQLCTYD
jgi:prepilin-type N-terminal cleavage/methylation domain-containing protein